MTSTVSAPLLAASASPAIADAIGRLMAAYMPCAGAPQPPTYADWIPAASSWPPELLALHSACCEARRAWAHATRADTPHGAGVAVVLAAIAYHAIERTTREAIAEWTRQRMTAGDPGELAGAARSSAQELAQEEGEGEAIEEEGPTW